MNELSPLSMCDLTTTLSFFLLEKTGSVCGKWHGRISAKEQRYLFGAYCFGKKELWINGEKETVMTVIRVCYGQDYDSQEITWANIEKNLKRNPNWVQVH